MLHQGSRAQDKKIVGISASLALLAIPFLALKQSSVAIDELSWAVAVALAGAALGILAPRLARLYLLLSVFAWLVLGVGVTQFGATLLWFASAWSIGALVLRRVRANDSLSCIGATEAALVGAAIWLAIWGAMLHFQVSYQPLHILLCLLPCLLVAGRTSGIRIELRSKVAEAQDWMNSIPLWAWVAGLAVIGWTLRWTSFPSMSFDDHALHLRMWTELLTHHRYAFDVQSQIWSVSPFVVDLLHAGLSLMAGNDARGAMNLALATVLLILIARILLIWQLQALAQWLLIVLMASTPMLANLLLSLQTELALAVLAVAGMYLVIGADGGWRGQHVLGLLSCAALCAGIKLPGAVLGVSLLAGLALRCWGQRGISTAGVPLLRASAFLLFIPLAFVALHSYVMAWKVTGNPVFPLYNAVFLSPFYAPVNFSDTLWIHGFGFSSYVRAFFHTSEFFESGDYTAGWQFLLLLPLAIVGALRPGMPVGLRIALIPLFGFGLMMFSATQYWRYLFPVMPIAGILLAALFVGGNRGYRALIVTLTLVCVVLNVVLLPRVSWMMSSTAAAAFTAEGKKITMGIYAPAAALTEQVNQLAPGSRVLYPSTHPYGASLHGTPLYVNWYSPSRSARFGSLTSTEEVGRFIAEEQADFAITNMTDVRVSGSPDALLREHLARFGSVVAKENAFLLYRVSATPLLYRKVFDLQASSGKALGETELLLPLSGDGIEASGEPRQLAVVNTYRASQARYSVAFKCPSDKGYFVAQINWDKGTPYYRLVACKPETSSFVEAVPIPVGATSGIAYVTARDSDSVQVENLMVEVH